MCACALSFSFCSLPSLALSIPPYFFNDVSKTCFFYFYFPPETFAPVDVFGTVEPEKDNSIIYFADQTGQEGLRDKMVQIFPPLSFLLFVETIVEFILYPMAFAIKLSTLVVFSDSWSHFWVSIIWNRCSHFFFIKRCEFYYLFYFILFLYFLYFLLFFFSLYIIYC